jgi:hypothetical protein
MLSTLKFTTTVRMEFSWRYCSPILPTQFKCYKPPVKLSQDEVRRLKLYCGLPSSPVPRYSGTVFPFPPRGIAAPGVPDASSAGEDTVPDSGSSQHPGQDSGSGGAAFGAGGSSAFLQALYETDEVKGAFEILSYRD